LNKPNGAMELGGDKYHKICRFAKGVVLQGRALEVFTINPMARNLFPLSFW